MLKESQKLFDRLRLLRIATSPSRFWILVYLSEDGHGKIVNGLAEYIDSTPSNTSHQLKVLVKEGLVDSVKNGREVKYRLTAKGKKIIKILLNT